RNRACHAKNDCRWRERNVQRGVYAERFRGSQRSTFARQQRAKLTTGDRYERDGRLFEHIARGKPDEPAVWLRDRWKQRLVERDFAEQRKLQYHDFQRNGLRRGL